MCDCELTRREAITRAVMSSNRYGSAGDVIRSTYAFQASAAKRCVTMHAQRLGIVT